MDLEITIARPATEVQAWLTDPAHLPLWVPQLRREEGPMPAGAPRAEPGGRLLRWHFAPAGAWELLAEAGGLTRLRLHLDRETAPATDPTERETPHQAALHGAEAALHSLKSHLEMPRGGAALPSRLFGHSATQEPEE